MNRSAKTKTFSQTIVLICIFLGFVFICATALAETPSSSVAGVEKQAPTMFWVTVVIVTIFLALIMLSIARGLASSETWSLADTLSEEADPQPAPPAQPDGKPVMVGSSSRLIAMLGLVVVLALFLGVGYYLLWALFTGQDFKQKLEGVTSYFYAGIVLFAPYIANKFSDTFSIFKPKG
jgi:hypothetical protein